MHIDFLGIQAFLAVAECGTFGLAASRLHLTQAAISHRMRKLEEALGTQLIVRTSRGVSLTQAGEALLPRAKQSLRQLEETWDVVRKHGRSAPAWVSFGCLPTVQHHAQGDLVFFEQEDLARLHLHIVHHQTEGFVQDFFEFQARSQGRGDAIQEGHIHIAARQSQITFFHLVDQSRIRDGGGGIGCQHLDNHLIVR